MRRNLALRRDFVLIDKLEYPFCVRSKTWHITTLYTTANGRRHRADLQRRLLRREDGRREGESEGD